MKKVDGVSKNDRLINYIIDTVAISILATIFFQIPSRFTHSYFFPVLVFTAYYFILELSINQTLGKMVTKTKVISVKNKRPHFLHILARTILRLASPFDTFSYLTGGDQGIHDILSQTRLVKVPK
ncbi:MAG: hypothetical protein COA38_11340 [Fluviicola sp.]|nr:MAG: hypothetical protein COA38_11340 [Fluviicola sp.]